MLEQDILAGLKKGNKKVLDELFTRYYVRLTRYALRQINDSMVAQEIVQDAYIYIWNKRDSIQINKSIEAYLFKSVANKCINHVKSKIHKIDGLTTDVEAGSNKAVSVNDLEVKELQQLIELTLKSLPEKTALIYSFSRNSGLTYDEIAEKLDISPKTVDYHICSALRQMKKVLQKYGYVFSLSLFINFWFPLEYPVTLFAAQ
jgi:RNA polymerase sigma-70 factor, ECF subfamily